MATLDFDVPASSDVIYEHSTLGQILQRIDTLTLKDSIAYLQNELRDGHLYGSEVQQIYGKIRELLITNLRSGNQDFVKLVKSVIIGVDQNLAITTHYPLSRIIDQDTLRIIQGMNSNLGYLDKQALEEILNAYSKNLM